MVMQQIEPLRTTDGLSDDGIFKKWPWRDDDHYELMTDLILKLNYSIQDFNSTIEGGFSGTPKDVVYLIVLATWIKDSYWRIKSKCLRKDVASGFEFSRCQDLILRREYLKAVRSAVVAHPVDTSQHEDYGFGPEGRICGDIRGQAVLDGFPGAVIRRVTFDGVVDSDGVGNEDIVLMTCLESPSENGGLHFERHCLNMVDVRDAAAMYIDALYELDRYLARARIKDFN